MPFLLLYWKQILYAVAAAMIVGLLYRYVVYIPNQLEKQKQENAVLQKNAEQDKKTVELSNDIQKEKERIGNATFQRISTLRSKPVPRNSVLVPGGMRLRSVY